MGGIFLGRDLMCVPGVMVIESGVMVLSPPFLMALMNRSFCDVTAARSADV